MQKIPHDDVCALLLHLDLFIAISRQYQCVVLLQSGPKTKDGQRGSGVGPKSGAEQKTDPEELLRRAVCTCKFMSFHLVHKERNI